VVHNLQYVQDSLVVVHSTDDSKSIVSRVKDNAISYLIRRSKRLFEHAKIGPVSTRREFIPG
jgi:hypothetical protein